MRKVNGPVSVKVRGSGMSDSAVRDAKVEAERLAYDTGLPRIVYAWGRQSATVFRKDARCKRGVRVVEVPGV